MTTSIANLVLPADERGVRRLEFRALGTGCVIQFLHPVEKTGRQFVAAALDWLSSFEAKFSRFQPDSVISKINSAAGREWIKVDAETEQLLDHATDLYHLLPVAANVLVA